MDDVIDNQVRKKIIVWDHSFHIKTKSLDFISDYLSQFYEIVKVWDESWRGGLAPDIAKINELKPYAVIFLQMLPSIKELKSLNCANRIWVPMYDSFDVATLYRYYKENIKIISFAKKLFNVSKTAGYTTAYLQYYPDEQRNNSPEPFNIEKLRIFFWQRTSGVHWQMIRKMFENEKVEKVVFVVNPDPGYQSTLPSEEDIKRFNIVFVHGWLEKEVLCELLNASNIFIAPRLEEGIGQAMLDAMARGLCVIAPDRPVMNEYIKNGVNGILYDPENITPLDLSKFEQLIQGIKKSMASGRKKYLQEEYVLHDFVEMKSNVNCLRFYPAWFLYQVKKFFSNVYSLCKTAGK